MKKRIFGVLLGIILLAAGIALVGNIIGIWDATILFDGWWAVLIMILSVGSMISDKPNIVNVYFLIFGGCMFLKNIGVIDEKISGWLIALALLIVIVGIRLIISALFPDKSKFVFFNHGITNEEGNGDSDTLIFTERHISYAGREFVRAECDVIFGKLVLDLRGAAINENAKINIDCVFGGVEIYVDSDVNAAILKSAVFGEARNDADRPEMTKRITGETEAVFGSVKIM